MKKFCKVFLGLLAILLLNFAFPSQGWGSTTYYAKAKAEAKPSSAAGTVYIGKANNSITSTGTVSNNASSTGKSANVNFYLRAVANSGYKFKGWSTSASWPGSFTQTTENGQQVSVSSSQTAENSASTTTYYGYFVKVFQFKAMADFATGSAGLGDVTVSFTSGSPAYQSTAKTDKTTQEGTNDTDNEETKTAYFYAQRHTGAEFRGWYSDAAGTVLVSSNEACSQSITSSAIAEPASPQLTLYAKFEKVAVEPTWTLEGVAGTSKTLEIGETIKLVTETDGNSYSWGTPSYVDAGETNPVMTYNPATKTFTANRAGTVTVCFTQTAGTDANGVLWKAGEQTFTFTVEKLTPEFAWADPLPHFTVGTTLPTSQLFSFTPAEAEQNWTLTSSDPTNVPSIASGAAGLFMPKEVDGVTLTFHQAATWKWNEIENTSIKINVTKEPVVFNWKNPSLVAGNNYSWTDFVETNSLGAWNLVSDDESVIPTMRSIAKTSVKVAAGSVTLSFTQGQDLGHDAVSIQTKTFTVYPSNGIATYLANSKSFTELNAAISEASKMSKNKYVFVASDGVVLPGTYDIPSGVTLVVPYESTNQTSYITKPKELANSTLPIEAYRTLKLVDGVTINVSGAIAVCAQVQSGDASHNPSGFPVGPVGVIDMSMGGAINVKSGGTLYAWGFIKGEGYLDGNNTTHVGSITAENNSTIWECFGMGDWNGGSFTYAAGKNSSSYKIFPFQSYYVQNIEVPLHMKYGAQEKLFASFYANSSTNNTNITFISYGSNTALFLVTENTSTSEVVKRYDPTTDHMVVDLVGKSTLGSLDIKISYSIISVTASSKSFDLPIVNNMHIRLIDCDLSLTSPVKMFPGSVFEVTKGSKLSVSTKVYVFDHDDWGKVVNKHYFGVTPKTLSPHVNLGDNIDVNTLEDAKIIVDGSVVITSGGIFTSPAGANIMGNGGGTFKWSGALPANATTNGYTLGSSVDGSNTSSKLKTDGILATTCIPAKLHNDAETANDSYTAAVGSKTFYNVNGRWFVQDDKDEKSDHTYNFKYLNDGNTVTTPAVYASDKTGLMAGYKWVNVALDNDFCGGKTFRGEDGNYYYYDNASKDAVSKWIQLVKLSDALYSGSDNNLYTFSGCTWASVGEIGDDCMYTVDEVKMALVGTEFISLEKDEYDEVYVKTTDHSDYYMLFDGCVWQHATKIPDTYKAYEVLDNPYIWLNNEWTKVAAEGAYFYTTDDQGLKQYYEFDDVTFAWVPARNKVRITTPTGDKRDFLSFDDAISYLSQYNDPTITLLEDVTATKAQTFAPGSKSTTATIDLNGHTVTAELGAAEYLLNMNTSATLEITDNSDKENGEIRVYTSVAKRADVIRITKGAVKMTKGKLFIHNANNTNSGNASAIYANAGQSVTMDGGELEAISTRYAYGIYSASSGALMSSSIVTVNGGTISATAKDYAYGILGGGIINMNGGTINSTTTTVNGVAGANYAYGIYANASSNATASSCYYATVNMTGGVVNATSQTTYAEGIYAHYGQTVAGATSYKAYTNKASGKLNITGGEINAKCLTSTNAYGVYAIGTENSNGSSAKHIIKDCKITASATGTAYGVIFSASLHDLSGIAVTADAEIENADIYAETTSANTAAAVYANATSNFMSRAKYNNGTTGVSAANKKLWFIDADNNDGDLTHEAIAVSGDGAKKTYKCYIGGEGAGAHVTIKSGNFRAKSAYQYAYGAYANRSLCLYDGTEGRGEITILGGTFTAETAAEYAYVLRNAGIMNIKGGTFNSIAGTSTSYGVYAEAGLTTIDGGTFNIDATTTTAYGVMATGVKEDNTGWEHRGEVVINDGVFNAHALGTKTVAGVYAVGTYVELNQTKYDARTDANKQYYYPVDENGVKLANATIANYYPYKYGVHTPSGKITVNGGTFNAKAFTSEAFGAYANMSSAVRTDMIGRQGVARGEIIIHGGEFNSETETSSTAEGIRSYGTVYVDGGTFNVKSKTTTAYGLYVMDGTTTIDGGTFNIAAGTNTAVGLRSHVYANTEYGYFEEGNAIINGGTFNVNTWGGNTAYGVYVTGAAAAFAATKSTAYTGTKPASYAAAGRATINGGTFIMNPSTGVDAYGFVLEGNKVNGDSIAYPKCEVNGGFFQMKGTGVYAANTSAVEDGEGNQNLAIKGGHFSTNNNLAVAKPKDYVRAPYAVINCIDPEYKATYPYEVGEPVEITFVTDNGAELWRGNQPKGKTAIYPLTNGTPERASDDAHSYEFTSWDKELAEVSEPTTYTANFNTVGKKFMITWVDDKGNEIDHKEYTADEMPVHADPIKEGYNFDGWTPAMYVVDKDQTYKAAFSIKQYTIRWVDENGTLIREDRVNHGATPTKPANPTKEGYSFQAWNPGVVKATEDVTYTATYLLNLVTLTKAGGSPVPYTTFAAALTEANKADGGTLTLLQDVKVAGSAQSFTTSTTLDLNGHSLRGAVNKLITVNGTGKTVTVKDSKGGGMIDNTYATNAQLTAVYVTKGTFVLENGTIRVENPTTSSSASYYAAAVLVPASQSFVMNGGTLTSIANNDYAYGVYNLGTATINGGTINTQALTRSYGVRADNTTTIHDVTINANAIRTTYGVAVWSSVAGKTITINGGTFNGNATTTTGYAIDATAASTINVNGGKFKATTKPISNTGGATIKVAGGFYDKDTELAGMASPKKVVALVSEPEKAEGYNYKIVDAAYNVTFKAENGTVLQQTNVEKDLQPIYVGEAQTKPSTPKYAYDFDGWMDASNSQVYTEAELPVVSKDVVYTAHFVQRAVEYPITFTNIDGKGTDYVQMVAYGEVPVYNGPTPYMSGAVSNYAYTFIGWNPELIAVDGPASYSPRYDLVISHNVSFVINNASATTPTMLVVAEGAAVEHPADQLVDCQHIVGWYKDADLNEEWNFASDKLGEEDLILYAKWGTKTYTITWLDEFGDEIDQTVVNCGTTPTHANLYKPSTATYSYEWLGWNKTIVAATADATYKSLGFNQVAKRYAIIFNTNGGSVIDPIEQEVGTPVVAPADPTREGYTFAGWDKEIPTIMPAEDVTITASWTINKYAITFQNEDGTELQKSDVEYGATPTYNGATPTKASDAQYTYTFKGWDKEIVAVSTDATYTATYTATKNKYTLTWNLDGGEIKTAGTTVGSVEWGTSLTAPIVEKTGYTFAGWTPEVPATMPTEDVTCVAQWTEVPTTAKYRVMHYKLHIKDGEKFAEPFKKDESEVEIGSEVTPEFEEIEGYDNPVSTKTITISANPEENVVIYEYPISKDNTLNADGNIDAETEAYTVILAPGKTMNITGTGSVTAQNLVLQSVPGDNTGANLATTSNLEILGDVCIEIEMNSTRTMDDKLYYCFSVPFNVNVADGVKRLNVTNNTWSKAVLNTNYRVYTYNEADRAAKGPQDSNWTPFSDTQFVPGVFYLCAFDNSNYNSYRFYAADKTNLNNKGNIAVTHTGDATNGGWNGVANNGLTDNKLSGSFYFIQTLNSVKNSFESAKADEKPLAIGNAAMVQVSKEGSVVVGATPSAVAARRMGETASTEFINVRLYKENQDKHVDQIFIRASEDAAEQYVAGIDLSKATMGTPKVARLWVNDYDLQLVANEALMTNDQATFSLGMSAPANGEYTIALNEVPTDATIYLTENGSAIWNLNIAPAPISLSKGTENSYGLRLVHKINNVVTGFDEAVLNGNVQKVILNDHLYIIRDGKVYSAHGHAIK
ncbi:MAG: InlB B-repeat-containing protein [Paludibacteraceae bacterium]|nr:InlB B-repeat-containing protein [Paludibacteraceae bacterium]